ncbi:hypothetical protein [Streptomyces triticisoli]|jgi:hypothetical protein|uniref:hypothetical protein n=1 Tax=Streptomyces triticisoli TaxID=2182797 RepID=UPI001E2FC398|nr:hypothetical protein [Streptomyces triticisoli]
MQEARCPQPGVSSGEDGGDTRSSRDSRDNEDTEGGLGPTVALLVVSLTAAAVGVYLLSGFGLHSLNPRPRLFHAGFATAGVIVATVAAGAAVGNLAWLLTASRRRAATGAVPSDAERTSADG